MSALIRGVPVDTLIQNSGVTPFDSASMPVPLHFFPTSPSAPSGNYNKLSFGLHLQNIRYDFPVALEVKWDASAQGNGSADTTEANRPAQNSALVLPGDSLAWPSGSRNVQMRVVFLNPSEDPNAAATADITCRIIFFSAPNAWKQGTGYVFPSALAANQINGGIKTDEASVAGVAADTDIVDVSLTGRWKLHLTFYATVAMRFRVNFGTLRTGVPNGSLTVGVDGVVNTVIEIPAGTYDGDGSHDLTIQNIDAIGIGDGYSIMYALIPAGLNE